MPAAIDPLSQPDKVCALNLIQVVLRFNLFLPVRRGGRRCTRTGHRVRPATHASSARAAARAAVGPRDGRAPQGDRAEKGIVTVGSRAGGSVACERGAFPAPREPARVSGRWQAQHEGSLPCVGVTRPPKTLANACQRASIRDAMQTTCEESACWCRRFVMGAAGIEPATPRV